MRAQTQDHPSRTALFSVHTLCGGPWVVFGVLVLGCHGRRRLSEILCHDSGAITPTFGVAALWQHVLV